MHQLDHVFVFCQAGAPELARCRAVGLDAGLRREHRGQGTANACIGWADGYLELLWLADEQAARDPMVKPLGLHERSRWRETAASPFGICVRPSRPGTPPPFVPWDYRPAWLPADLSIAMACNSGVLGEPLLFQIDRPFTPFGGSPLLRDRRLTRAVLTVPDLAPMSILRDVAVPGLEIRDGAAPALDLHFADAKPRSLDLRPQLPLVLHV